MRNAVARPFEPAGDATGKPKTPTDAIIASMPGSRREKVKEIFSDALDLDPAQRGPFLEEACGGDGDLRRSVEGLLHSFENLGSAEPTTNGTSQIYGVDDENAATLDAGEQVGPYKIVERLGSGGMGEVYLAEDPRLGRRVAIKFLRKEFVNSRDPMRRFMREAKSASALNHPNIITIYEIGEWKGADYIAMECVQGESVRSLITAGKLGLDDAINIAIQVASALSAAHEAGIVHRDVKPENIMRRPDGIVKVLDFGLAKYTGLPTHDVDDEATTRGLQSTAPGMIMGTATYMSPEQARGKPVDARTDIWSLGVVLHEMIAGRPPFSGETRSDLLVAILRSEPPPLGLQPPELSHELEDVIMKALGKEVDERYQVIKDMLLDLKMLANELSDEILSITSPLSTGREGRAHSLRTLAYRASTIAEQKTPAWKRYAGPTTLGVVSIAAFLIWQNFRPREVNPYQSVTPTQIVSWKSDIGEGDRSRPRFSSDGRFVAYAASREGRNTIWIKQIDGGAPMPRKQDDSFDSSPIWSPNGNRLAYFSTREGRRGIWVVPAFFGGTPMLLTETANVATLVDWSADGNTIFFEMGQNLYSLDVNSRNISQLTSFDESQIFQRDFSVSRDGKRIAFSAVQDGQNDLWTADPDGKNVERLTNDPAPDSRPVWHPDGERIIFNSERNGIKQIFMVSPGRTPVQLTTNDSDNTLGDVSADGEAILYRSEHDESDIWGIDLESGKEFQVTADVGVEFWPEISPAGDGFVYQGARRTSLGDKLRNSEIYVQKFGSESEPVQIFTDGFHPRWSPDGRYVALLLSEGASGNKLFVSSAGGGDAHAVTAGGVASGGFTNLPYNRVHTQDYDWSPDSRSLVYAANRDGAFNVWQVNITDKAETQLTKNESRSLIFTAPLYSADGSAVYWNAMELGPKRAWSIWRYSGGQAAEIYRSDVIVRIVGWARGGKSLLLKSLSPQNDKLPPQDVDLLELVPGNGTPKTLAKLKTTYVRNIRVSPDGDSVAFVARPENGDAVMLLDLRTGAQKAAAAGSDARVYFSSLAFSPDGRKLFYGKQSNGNIISMIKATK